MFPAESYIEKWFELHSDKLPTDGGQIKINLDEVALEFLQHHSAKMGHRDLLVTHNLSSQSGNHISVHLTRSVRRTSGFVQTRISSVLYFLI